MRSLLLKTLAALCVCGIDLVSAVGRPNFVVFFVDDMGINQVNLENSGLYGYTGDNHTIATPNIKKLSDEGMTFQTWYSSFHVCSPSRASMMTGLYSVRVGVGIPNSIYAPNAPGPSAGGNCVFTAESVGGLPTNASTIAEKLKPLGYNTAAVGKWHLGNRDIYMPTSRGFDHYLGIPFSQDMGLSFWSTHGYKTEPPFFPTPLPLVHNLTIVEQPVGLHHLVKNYTSFIDQFLSTQTASTPFYLYVPWNHVHGPNSCSAEFCGSSPRGPIGDATQEVDAGVGEVMASLTKYGFGNNTLVFLTSDNGAPKGGDVSGNYPLRGYKATTWEGGFREPGIAWWPGKIKAGTISQAIVSTMDIFPTLLSVASRGLGADGALNAATGEVHSSIDGVSLDGIDISDIIFGVDGAKGHECYFFYKYAVAADAVHGLAAVRCQDYKAYWIVDKGPPRNIKPGPQEKPVLFNLVADPGENFPVPANSSEYTAAMAILSKARTSHLMTIQPVPNQNGRGTDPAYAMCGAPDSTARFPHLPNCTMNPENWAPADICASQACLTANKGYGGACKGPQPKPGICPGTQCPHVPPANAKGCFIDHTDGICDLPHVITGHCTYANGSTVRKVEDHGMFVEVCNAHCAAAGFSYFGVQMGGLGCFCGNQYGSQGENTTASACSMPCVGDAQETCGGPNNNAVYAVQPPK
eukprot:m.993232 g.993232  ORF g.993232 m.993232 type:complete len:693 (+) comp24011_c0_seq3:213-2291(+)